MKTVALGYADPTTAATANSVVTELLRSLYTIRMNNDLSEIIANDRPSEYENADEDNGSINNTVPRAL